MILSESKIQLYENKKVFKDDYGKDIVDPDEVKDWEVQYEKIHGIANKNQKPEKKEKKKVTEAMTATNGSFNDKDGEP